MTAFDFSFVKNTSVAFNATTDTINFGALVAANFTVAQNGADLTLTYSNGDFITLQNTTLEQLSVAHTTQPATGGNPNVLFTGSTSAIYIGDNTNGTAVDAIGNTLSTAAELYLNGNNLIYGLAGDDQITASGAGNQKIFGGSGADNIAAAGAGNNTIYGGNGEGDSTDGNDNITIGGGSNVVYANAGNDSITANATAGGTTTKIYLGLGNDTIASAAPHAGNFVVYGNSGNDVIGLNNTSTGDVTIYGGNGEADSTDGNDTITFGTGSAIVFGNSGNDTIGFGASASGKKVWVAAGLGDDQVTSGAGVLTSSAEVFGNSGNDTLNLGAHLGDTTIYGGNGIADSTDGNDVITVSRNKTTVYGNAGNDTINISNLTATTGEANVYVGVGNDVVNVDATNANTSKINIFLADGSDTLNLAPGAGANLININGFSAANDVVNYSLQGGTDVTDLVVSGNFIFNDSTGGNRQYASTTEAALNFVGYTGEFNNTNLKFTGAPTQTLVTNINSSAAATLTGGTGITQLVSGSTADTLVFATAFAAGTKARVDAGGGNDTIRLGVDQFTTVQTIAGGDGVDTIDFNATGTALADGDFANKTGIEVLKFGNFAHAGTQTLANTNAQVAGINTIDATAVSGGNTISITATTFTNTTNLTYTAGSGANTFVGGAGNDTITAGSGAASLTGGDGNDVITGGVGVDTLLGGAGNDTIVAGDGNDLITGGAGVDVLTGGAGQDTFFFVAADSLTTVASDSAMIATIDRITDWSTVDDTLQFGGLTGTAVDLTASAQATINALNAGAGAATLTEALNAVLAGDGAANSRYGAFQFQGNTYAFVDHTAGATVATTDVVVRLDGLHTLTAADFTIVV